MILESTLSIIQDNASIHRANVAKERVDIWSKQGLIIFSLPPYSPRHASRGKRASASGRSPCMNRIEEQWCRAYRLMSCEGQSPSESASQTWTLRVRSTTGGSPNRALKRQELAGRVFDDEYDLVLAIIQGVHDRGKQGNFSVERLMFN